MSDDSTAIKISDLSKRYKGGFGKPGVPALSGVNLQVKHGEIFGLLGPNGAGKTTLIKILLGALRPTSGTASINGYDISNRCSRREAGFLPENHRFPPYLTGMQMLLTFGGMSGLSRSEIRSKADALLEMVRMSKWRNTKIKKYSKGMMQRLGMAQAMLNDPETVFLDEPTDGVDPVGRHEIRTILLDLKKLGKTIFLNSHLLAEVEAICDRVAILDKGKLIRTGPVAGLIGGKPAYRVETVALDSEITSRVKENYSQATIEGNTITITFDEPCHINDLIDLLRQNRVELVSVAPVRMSLEESFLELIKGGERHE